MVQAGRDHATPWAPDPASLSVFGRLWTLLFPDRCLGCRRRGVVVCAECWASITWVGADVCPLCVRPSCDGRRCVRCRRSNGALDGLRAACDFKGVVRQAIHDLKYRQRRSLAPLVADLLVRALEPRPLDADLLVPVPLASGRRKSRGYNQSELIAEQLAPRIGLPCSPGSLARVRETPPQVGLGAAERRLNVRDAFTCPHPAEVAGKHIVLIDDVGTTGATLSACADALKAAGAARVIGLVVARGG